MSIINNAVWLGSFVAIPSRANFVFFFASIILSLLVGVNVCRINSGRGIFIAVQKRHNFYLCCWCSLKRLGIAPGFRKTGPSLCQYWTSYLLFVRRINWGQPLETFCVRRLFFLSFFSFLFLNCFFRPAGVSPTRRPKIKLRRLRTF